MQTMFSGKMPNKSTYGLQVMLFGVCAEAPQLLWLQPHHIPQPQPGCRACQVVSSVDKFGLILSVIRKVYINPLSPVMELFLWQVQFSGV